WWRIRTGMPGKTLIGSMLSIAPHNAAKDGEFIHHRRHFRKQLASRDPRHVGLNRREFTPDFGRSIHFQIPHILVGRTAAEENVNDGFLTLPRAGLIRGSQELRK